jgi:hypothetical protein
MKPKQRRFRTHRSIDWWVGKLEFGLLSPRLQEELCARMIRDVTFEEQFIAELKWHNELIRGERRRMAFDPKYAAQIQALLQGNGSK